MPKHEIRLKLATAREERLDLVWTNQRHNRIDFDISIWRPQQSAPYRSLGDILVRGTSDRPDSAVVVIDDKQGSVCDPISYQLVFCRRDPETTYSKRGKPKYLHLWRAVPPLGYYTLGEHHWIQPTCPSIC
jgi:hypothetical protein